MKTYKPVKIVKGYEQSTTYMLIFVAAMGVVVTALMFA